PGAVRKSATSATEPLLTFALASCSVTFRRPGTTPCTEERAMRKLAVLAGLGLRTVAPAQGPPKPGPEHELLKKHVGTWDTTMKADGMEFKGVVTFKMELGGLWLVGSLESDLAGQKFSGRSMDTYDAAKKKYVGLWFDSMSTTHM